MSSLFSTAKTRSDSYMISYTIQKVRKLFSLRAIHSPERLLSSLMLECSWSMVALTS